ncbi:MAG TPA: class I SAM-dependent methyltransferase [Acidimicrobiales bacterium]|nr:class I SAM-dependent methyltransferase [Acidimicrobiales bacterium]
MSAASRFVDRLPVNPPYDGVTAVAYDAWMPPDTRFPDDGIHADIVRRADGGSLELGVGTGRFLVPLVEQGYHLEGIDSSADMLDRCRRHAAARHLDVMLHHGDIAPLTVPRRYGALVCPAGSFGLVVDKRRATAALASYLDHLQPGGTLAISMTIPGPGDITGFTWRLRRTATDDDATTYVVHEATGDDREPQVMLVYNRLEVYDASGRLVSTQLRKHRLRWWTQDQFAAALHATGFIDNRAIGTDTDWVTVTQRP